MISSIQIPDYTYESTFLFISFLFDIKNITISKIHFDSNQFELLFQDDNTTSANMFE